MAPGIGLMKKRLETEKQAIALAVSGVVKKYSVAPSEVTTLEIKYDDELGDWYVALGFADKRAVVRMDSVHATISEINEI
ncbi:hypothetical protein [Candidatus Nitrosotenuis uzonensis]|nr:hypothetical protein [Candidatus Nitrosotenuis uzonensis]